VSPSLGAAILAAGGSWAVLSTHLVALNAIQYMMVMVWYCMSAQLLVLTLRQSVRHCLNWHWGCWCCVRTKGDDAIGQLTLGLIVIATDGRRLPRLMLMDPQDPHGMLLTAHDSATGKLLLLVVVMLHQQSCH